MAGNAFKTRHGVVKLSATEKVSNKKKKLFFTKRMMQQHLFSEPSTLFDNGSLPPCWTRAADALSEQKSISSFSAELGHK